MAVMSRRLAVVIALAASVCVVAGHASPATAAPTAPQPQVLASRLSFGDNRTRSVVAFVDAAGARTRLAESTGFLYARAWSATTGKVYFSHSWGPIGADATEVDAMASGGAPSAVVHGASNIDISRDGAMMVYVGHDQLYIGPVAGGPVHQLTGAGGINPRISPDGTKVLFSREYRTASKASLDLFVIGTDGTGLRRLTASDDFDLAGTWSPDGTRVLFSRSSRAGWDLWAMGLDHSGLRHVAHDAAFADWNSEGWLIYLTHIGPGDGGDLAIRSPGVPGVEKVLTTDGGWSATRFRQEVPAG
jgi:dipeptidyl aminopeptidase/acylaminoacyl peptidase